MPHENFDTDIAEHADEFEAAEEAMRGIVDAFARGDIDMPTAETYVQTIAADLTARSGAWVIDVVPQVYVDGIADALEAPDASEAATEGASGGTHQVRVLISQRRILRRLDYASDGLLVDALDKIDAVVEESLDAELVADDK